jgi:uncharacterized protein (TIGR03000 family)
MYSVVLAAVLTTGAATPDWHLSFGCHGCSGCVGCTGCSGCHGCYGCYGCYGCHGCSGCCGGCYGCGGGYGGSYAFSGSYVMSSYNFYSCSGGSGCWGCGGGGMYRAPVEPEKPPVPKAPAKVQVTVPDDTRLFVDNVPYPTMQEKITFDTPQLDADRTYYYTLTVERVRDGKVYRDSRRVDVVAGKETKVEFKDLPIVQAVKR